MANSSFGQRKKRAFILIGDVGGTKTTLALFTPPPSRPRLILRKTFPSRAFDGITPLIQKFLDYYPAHITSACFGVAGRVKAGRSQLTNLGWKLSQTDLVRNLKIKPVYLINDAAATAMAVPFLRGRALAVLNPGRPNRLRTAAVMTVGTGLGQAFLQMDGKNYHPLASEGGHSAFSPQSKEQVGLWEFMHQKLGHVSWENILSGPGLASTYQWLSLQKQSSKKIKALKKPIDISQAALANDPTAVTALRIFAEMTGTVAANMALTLNCYGGVYIGGGIPPKIAPFVQKHFLTGFTAQGLTGDYLKTIPVRLILNPHAALWGAVQYLKQSA